jgi:hypothetical protein
VTTTIHELDHRHNDGIDVTLLWDADTNRVSVFVRDARAGESFEVDVEPSRALDAFHHPYAYAATSASAPPAGVAT